MVCVRKLLKFSAWRQGGGYWGMMLEGGCEYVCVFVCVCVMTDASIAYVSNAPLDPDMALG